MTCHSEMGTAGGHTRKQKDRTTKVKTMGKDACKTDMNTVGDKLGDKKEEYQQSANPPTATEIQS